MVGYGWEEYDVRTGGKQVMYDKGNMIDISTEFVKVSSGNHGKKAYFRLLIGC
jgi:mannosyl-oligosaccharide glucosidase